MLTVLSPAKSLDLARSVATPRATQPRFLDRSETLVEKLRTYTAGRLAKLMSVSDDLARLNAERYAAWERPFTPRNARKAVLVFDGDVYAGLDAASTAPSTGTTFSTSCRIGASAAAASKT